MRTFNLLDEQYHKPVCDMHGDTMIEIKNLNYQYEDGTVALQNVNLTINKGEKIAIMGPNGSGKSTLFLCLNGVYKQDRSLELYFRIQIINYLVQMFFKRFPLGQ